MYRLFVFRWRASLLVLERAEHRLLALDAHENAEDRRRDDDVAHGLVALGEASDVAELTGMPASEYHLPASFSWYWYLDLGSW